MAALLFSTTCVAQPNAPVAKPEVKVDDRWVYRHTDRRRKPPTSIYELRVTFVDSRVIHAVVEQQGRRKETDATWTPEWNVVVAVDEGVVELDEARNTFWDVPHIKRWVKHVYQDVQLEVVEELYFYRVQ